MTLENVSFSGDKAGRGVGGWRVGSRTDNQSETLLEVPVRQNGSEKNDWVGQGFVIRLEGLEWTHSYGGSKNIYLENMEG